MKKTLNDVLPKLVRLDDQINSVSLIEKYISQNDEHDPFYVVDLEDICNKHVQWITSLPRVEPHYAMKCNGDKILLKLLAHLGVGFDCASKNEIQTILDLGVAPDRIIYANPCKQASYIKYACEKGVDTMTFDNEDELYKIKANHPHAKLVLRIITNDADAVCRFSMKFGADMTSSLKLIDLALKLNLNLIGISFHVGSGQMSPKAFSEAIGNARALFDYAIQEHDYQMYLLDIGGGFPGAHENSNLFTSITNEINKSLEEYFPKDFINNNRENKLRIIAEPGRYYACSAYTLCVNVIAKREVTDNNNNSKSFMYYINDGVYSSFNCIFYDHITEFTPILFNNKSNQELNKSSVWGPTCDGLDCVLKETELPELYIGEFMAFKNMGAYTIAGAVAFNGIPIAKTLFYTVASSSWETIKAAFVEYQETVKLIAPNSQSSLNILNNIIINTKVGICASE